MQVSTTNHSMGCPVILKYAILYDGDISATLSKICLFSSLLYNMQEWKRSQTQWRSNNSPDDSGFLTICTKTGEHCVTTLHSSELGVLNCRNDLLTKGA